MTSTLDMLYITTRDQCNCVTQINFFLLRITTDFIPGGALGAEDLDKAVSVETLACLTQWKMNLVILFVFQVFTEHGDAPAAPASRPVHVS